MDVGIPGADHDAVIVVKQQKAVECVGPGLQDEEHTEQRGTMSGGSGRESARRPLERDVAAYAVDHGCNDRTAKEQLQQPVLERKIGGQREQIEADVLAEDRIVLAVGHLMKEAQHQVPVGDLAGGDEQPQDDSATGNADAPGNARCELVRQFTDELRRTRQTGRFHLPATGTPRVTMRKESRCGDHARRRCEHGGKEERFGGDSRPENAGITD